MTEVSPVGLLAVDHVGIAVPDLAEAIRFYDETLGGSCVHVERNEEQGVEEAMISIGNGPPQIQLLAPLSQDSTIAKFIGRSGPGLQQLAFTVADITIACESLRAKGIRLLYETPKRGTADSKINFVHPRDAGGVLIELVEPA